MTDFLDKIDNFKINDSAIPVEFVETQEVCQGVLCHVYKFLEAETSRDLAVIQIKSGHKTPVQIVQDGDITIEGFVEGNGSLIILRNGEISKIEIYTTIKYKELMSKGIELKVGDIVQWQANLESDLVAYEICYPPFQEGRFRNLEIEDINDLREG